jgi:chaperonin cofactor prefoldin
MDRVNGLKQMAVRLVWVALFAFLIGTAGPSVVFAQTDPNRPRNPRPTPTPDLPEVVSRDADIEEMVRDQTRETTPRTTAGGREPADQPKLGLDALSAADQQKLVFYLDILTKLEQRAESLRSQLISLTEKENSISTKIQQIEFNLRPDMIANYTALSGSLRPEALREQRQSDLEIERKNLDTLLSQIEASRSALEANLRSADDMAERMRTRFEAVLEAALEKVENP